MTYYFRIFMTIDNGWIACQNEIEYARKTHQRCKMSGKLTKNGTEMPEKRIKGVGDGVSSSSHEIDRVCSDMSEWYTAIPVPTIYGWPDLDNTLFKKSWFIASHNLMKF